MFFDNFCGKRFGIWSFVTLSNLPRWIPHYGDDISRIRISTSADFHAYWSIFGPKTAFVQSSVKRTEAPGQPRDQIFHAKSSQSCRSPSLTMGNCVTYLLTHFHDRWSRADRLESRFTFKNQHFWSKTSFCTVWVHALRASDSVSRSTYGGPTMTIPRENTAKTLRSPS